jgi:predicted transposase/invertase (TIGR01784 family)
MKGKEEERARQECQHHQEKLESAKTMHQSGINITDIARFTGLDEAELKTLFD